MQTVQQKWFHTLSLKGNVQHMIFYCDRTTLQHPNTTIYGADLIHRELTCLEGLNEHARYSTLHKSNILCEINTCC